jgi:hypothetical protein
LQFYEKYCDNTYFHIRISLASSLMRWEPKRAPLTVFVLLHCVSSVLIYYLLQACYGFVLAFFDLILLIIAFILSLSDYLQYYFYRYLPCYFRNIVSGILILLSGIQFLSAVLRLNIL